MKKLNIILLLFCTINAAYSQRIFEYVEKTEELSVFIDKDPEVDKSGGSQAGVTISCVSNIPLKFETNLDKTVDVYKTEQKGAVTYYYLRFIVGRYKGAIYSGRVLQVLSNNFLPLRIRLDLKSSESKNYEIYDPNVNSAEGCFYKNFNEAADLFKKSMYEDALKKYISSTDCADYLDNMGVMQKIDIIKSIVFLRERADYLFNTSNFKDAIDAYQKIIGYNNEDQYAIDRHKEALGKHSESCTNYYNIAENYFREGRYDEAEKLYNIIIGQSCSYQDAATLRLSEIKKIASDNEKKGKEKEKVVMYELLSLLNDSPELKQRYLNGVKKRTTGTGIIIGGAALPAISGGIGYLVKFKKDEREGDYIFQSKYNHWKTFTLIGAVAGAGVIAWGIHLRSAGNKEVRDAIDTLSSERKNTQPGYSLKFELKTDGIGLTYNF